MSIAALLRGVETRLRSAAVLDDQPAEAVGKVCGVQPDGAPPPNAGQWYYAVHFAGLRNDDPDSLSLSWRHSVTVTVTGRMAYAPRDRRGARMALDQELLDRALVVAAALHQDETTMDRANELIAGTAEYAALNGGSATVNGFVECLRLRDIGAVREATPSFLGTADGKTEAYYLDVKFGDALRVQYLPG